MNTEPRWTLSENDKNDLISALTAELAVFRTKAGISQEELAGLIGVTRQTYGAFERKTRRMTWSTFASCNTTPVVNSWNWILTPVAI